MPATPLLAAYLCCASLVLEVLAFCLYWQNRDSLELRFAAVVTFLSVALVLAFAPLLLIAVSPTAKAAFIARARTEGMSNQE